MYQTINEPIEIAGVYSKSTFTPKKFRWRHKEFLIKTITWRSDVKDGGIRKRLYSLMSANELYRVEFNRENETWSLLEMWIE